MRIEDLRDIFSNEDFAFNFAFANNLIDNTKICSNDHEETYMVLNKSEKMRQKMIWRCNKCNKTCSILKGSIFYHLKLPISKVLFIIYMWAHEFSIKGETLLDCITKNIRIGTNIISDKWSGYNGLDREPLPQQYTHESVNHKENFVDPETGANT